MEHPEPACHRFIFSVDGTQNTGIFYTEVNKQKKRFICFFSAINNKFAAGYRSGQNSQRGGDGRKPQSCQR